MNSLKFEVDKLASDKLRIVLADLKKLSDAVDTDVKKSV